MLRSILAVFAGYLFMIFSIVLYSVVLSVAAPTIPSVVSSPSLMITNIIFWLIVALVGGFITGSIAKRKILLHVGILSGIILVVWVVNVILIPILFPDSSPTIESSPLWFQATNTLAGVLGVLAGGFIKKKLG